MDTYFAALPLFSPVLSREIMARVDRFYMALPGLRPYQRARRNRQLYYGLPSEASPFDVGVVGEGGEQGELSQVHINRFGHLGRRILAQTVQDDFGWQPVASSGDTEAQEETSVARSLLEHEKRHSKLHRVLRTAMEGALLDGESWYCVRWDVAAGPKYDVNPDTGTAIHEGRLRVTNHSFFRVVVNTSKHNAVHTWVILTEFVNRWDLAARYPAHAERILSVGPDHRLILDWQRTARGWVDGTDEREEVPVYTFLHKPTPACPEGRETVVVDADTVLFDGPSVYGPELPAFRLAPEDMLDTPWSSTPLTDLSALQAVYNMLMSTAVTNNANNGVPMIGIPREANISRMALEGATILEFEGQRGPEAINLVNTAPETYKLAGLIAEEMVTLSGNNAVSMGGTIPQLSGAAMALLDSKSLQFATPWIAAYRDAVENLGTSILDRYKRFAKAPRALEVTVGKARRYMLNDFTGRSLGDVTRVAVESRSALLDTAAGKMDMAEKLLAIPGALGDGEKAARALVQVYRTGNLDPLLKDGETEDLLISRENDALSRGEDVPVLLSDPHAMHIKSHRAVVASMEARGNPAIIAVHAAHEQAHIDALRQTDPGLLAVLGQQPIPPDMPMLAAASADMGPQPPPEGVDVPVEGEPLAPAMARRPPGTPELPTMPGMPINPMTGEPAPLPPVAANQ